MLYWGIWGKVRETNNGSRGRKRGKQRISKRGNQDQRGGGGRGGGRGGGCRGWEGGKNDFSGRGKTPYAVDEMKKKMGFCKKNKNFPGDGGRNLNERYENTTQIRDDISPADGKKKGSQSAGKTSRGQYLRKWRWSQGGGRVGGLKTAERKGGKAIRGFGNALVGFSVRGEGGGGGRRPERNHCAGKKLKGPRHREKDLKVEGKLAPERNRGPRRG